MSTGGEHCPRIRTQGAKQHCDPAGVVTEPTTLSHSPAQGQWQRWQFTGFICSEGLTGERAMSQKVKYGGVVLNAMRNT